MISRGFFLVLLLPVTGLAASPEEIHFQQKVKPLLDSRCISCHNADKQKGNLRLDSRAAALKGGDTGPALVPGKPKQSLLLQAVLHNKPDLEMPPKEKLTRTDIAVLERWILDGAPWPAALPGTVVSLPLAGEVLGDAWSDPHNPIVKIFGGQRLDLWSFRPPIRLAPPRVKNKTWPRQPLDHFVLAQLEKAGLKPSMEADKRTLARRVSFGLTGLPPTPEEMNHFLQDQRPGAYERLVNRLLESPRYGEHWARLWLDVVRYSDSNGFDWDEFRPRAWRFRDYVIRSFNADKPFDQFVREQLAGDELLEEAPLSLADQDRLLATGYLRLGPHDNSAPSFNEQDRSRAELMADLVETTGSAFLGMTLSCCRCHDHKYDPLSQADHFRLRAFFEPVKFADDLPINLAGDQERIRNENKKIDETLKPRQAERDELLDSVRKKLREERVSKLAEEERLLFAGRETQSKLDQKKRESLEKKVEPSEKEIVAAFSEEQKKKHQELGEQIAALKKTRPAFDLALLMTDGTNPVPPTHLLFQGDHQQPREPVAPGFFSALNPNPARVIRGDNPRTTGRRLTLAEWIVSPTNPLTARVLVNRLWQAHFGEGLVATPNDFGLAGAHPSQPELLDWLAVELVRQGWSIKELQRQLVTSAAYRQTRAMRSGGPQAPPGFAGQQPRRLTAEQLRDSLLQVSGALLTTTSGPPVWPELPADILQANPAFLDDNSEKTKAWYPSPGEKQSVRSIFLVQKKTVRVPFMETFDLPENSTSCARRTESIVAPQALTLLNGVEAITAANALAARIEKEGLPQWTARVDRLFALALQRPPTPEESARCREFLKKQSLAELCRTVLNLNEFIFVD